MSENRIILADKNGWKTATRTRCAIQDRGTGVTEREAQLLRDVAALKIDEIGPSDLSYPYDRNYFKRLTDKALLVRVGRGRYKL